MKDNNLIGINIQYHTKKEVLDNIKKNIGNVKDFFHIVSLNGEIMVISEQNKEFKKVLSESAIRLVDGASVALGCYILNITYGERIPGADLMEDILRIAGESGSRVLFLGGREDLAGRMAKCYSDRYPAASFKGLQGFTDILAPRQAEYDEIEAVLKEFGPNLVLAAYGSPYQELFFYRHRASFKSCICMGVGGGFDFALRDVPRAPRWMRIVGLEWLFRLAIQPWRLKRQLRLFSFILLILKQKYGLYSLKHEN